MISICGRDGDRSGESEPDVHAARIRLQRLVDEIADLREVCDLRKQILGFGF